MAMLMALKEAFTATDRRLAAEDHMMIHVLLAVIIVGTVLLAIAVDLMAALQWLRNRWR